MKHKIYLKIGQQNNGRLKFGVSKKKTYTALSEAGWGNPSICTVIVPLNIEIPDTIFEQAVQEVKLIPEYVTRIEPVFEEEELQDKEEKK